MFERPQAGERAVLVHLALQAEQQQEEPREFRELAVSAGAEPIAVITGSRAVPHPRYFVGTGKAEEIRDTVRELQADLVLFNHALSPVQERNLEQLLKCRVLDRTGLILDIFAQRARTHEGKLQVELAQLKHLSTRLVRGWTHLERQKGGIGLRGPGETQLETDRRLIGERIRQLNKRLEKVQRQREQGRRARKRREIPSVSLVGYTNAGKSTLFNRLTDSHVYAADQLFATLDPTLRRLELADGQALILADTVGFIRHLPHDLVAAFRSTLQETRDADLLLHVVDASSPERDGNIEQVDAVLAEIEASDVPQLLVYNKIDQLEESEPRIEYDEHGLPWRVWISAQSGTGLAELREALAARLDRGRVCHELLLPVAQGRLHALLYEVGKVHREQVDEQGNWLMTVEMPRADWDALDKHYAIGAHLAGEEDVARLAHLAS
ncbi:ribosome rescue GTPase HflX [Thiohalophilus sp.]|uniref:ribosome rescue GTPase HflX n=1 Tax=Thiohalophilus sp. TaxID=3028392 RepID=UPI002ACEB923|nr:ribosome rescue GTPase HflX [Thiohalophilus sp.]MDZ7802538.1 ribosome rescue GTPase HflX [Thiohalophilus sp.]